MKPSVCTPFAFICTAIASAISASLCGVLKIHFVFGFAGSTIRADAAIEIIGVSAAEATSTIASEFGVIVEPTTTSTLSSEMSFFVFVTAFVVSEASSRMIQLTFWPPIVAGRSSNVFFSGMPSDAAGPVADSVTPTLMSACDGPAAPAMASAATSAGSSLRTCMKSPPEAWVTRRRPADIRVRPFDIRAGRLARGPQSWFARAIGGILANAPSPVNDSCRIHIDFRQENAI